MEEAEGELAYEEEDLVTPSVEDEFDFDDWIVVEKVVTQKQQGRERER